MPSHLIFMHPKAEGRLDEYFTQPFKISYKGDTSALQRFFSSFPTKQLLDREINQAATRADFIGEETASEWLDKYLVQSLFNHCCYLVITSVLYRGCQLLSLEARHRIAQSELNPTAKFICTSLAISFPVFIIYLTGGAYGSILVSSAIDLTASYALPTLYSNFFKKIDLIATTRSWKPANFIFQNVKLLARYAAIDFLILNKLLEPILNIQHPTHFLVEGELINGLQFPLRFHKLLPLSFVISYIAYGLMGGFRKGVVDKVTLRRDIEEQSGAKNISRVSEATGIRDPKFFNSPTALGATSRTATSLIYLTHACAWLLGRIMIDGMVILLHRKKIVGDLRSPFSTLFSQPILDIQAFLKKKVNPTLQASKIVLSEELKTELRRQHLEKYSSGEVSISAPIEDTSSSHIRSRKKPSTRNHTSPVNANTEVKESAVEKIERAPIQIPGYNRTIVPLNSQSAASNIWGLIVYDLRDRDPQSLAPYVTSLESAHLGNRKSAIKPLGKGKVKRKWADMRIYEIRPPECGDRLLGYEVTGEDNIHSELQRYLPYEVALPFFEQMQYEGKPASLVIFSDKIKHEKINDYVKGK